MLKFTFPRYLLRRIREEYARCYAELTNPYAGKVHPEAVIRKEPWCDLVLGEGTFIDHGACLTCVNPRREPLETNSFIRIGRNVYVGRYSNLITGGGHIIIGDNVLVAHSVSIVASGHGTVRNALIQTQPCSTKQNVEIGNDVWLGAAAIILPGVCVSDGAVVGAGAVVTHDVLSYVIVAGNPARVIGERK